MRSRTLWVRFLVWIGLLNGMMLASPSVLAETDLADIPMAVANNAPPNFMFMIDNSVSMGETVAGPGGKTRLSVAKSVTNSVLSSIPLKNASVNAKARVGLASFKTATDHDGGRLLVGVRDLDQAHLDALTGKVNSLTATANTPLAETLADIGQYFSLDFSDRVKLKAGLTNEQFVAESELFRQKNGAGSLVQHSLLDAPTGCSGISDCPIQYWCQRSYAIMLTDGTPREDDGLRGNEILCDYDGDSAGDCASDDRKTDSTHKGHLGASHVYDVKGSDYLDDVAQALYEADLVPDLADREKKNNLRTYTIGFLVDDPLLRETAAQGGGLFLSATDEISLKNAFSAAIDDALNKDSAAAAVAVTSSQIAANTITYMSSYTSGYWTGELEAFSVDPSTGLPIDDQNHWSAQAELDKKTSSSRWVVTWDKGGKVFSGAGLNDYLRGNRTGEGTTYRVRQHLLGDIINAEPVIVSYGTDTVVYQAANDGMLHVFNGNPTGAGKGTEIWAYVPGMLISPTSSLADFASTSYTHKYFVDATPAVGDVANTGFKTKILVGGMGKGGRGYFAIDIGSLPNSQAGAAGKVLWEVLPSNAGFTFGTPLIVKLEEDGSWVVLVSSGYNNTDGVGRIWALRPKDGVERFAISTGAGDAAKPSGLTHLARPSGAAADSATRYVWGGDLLGNVWRFDLTSRKAIKIAELSDGSGAPQPITTAPVVKAVPGESGKFMVYVGTGQYLGDSDVPGVAGANVHANQTQSVYGILDDVSASASAATGSIIRDSSGTNCPKGGGDGVFVCQSAVDPSASTYTFSRNPMTTSHRGWYLDIPVEGGRVNTHPALTKDGVLVFTVNTPSAQICDPGGSSWLFAVDAQSGGAVSKNLDGTESYESGWFIGNALGSRPVIVETSSGTRALIRMTDRTVKNPIIPKPPGAAAARWKRVYWRELM